jgi:hypothetical protein
MTKYNIRPATIEDIETVVGKRPPYSTRAWAVDIDDKVVCVSGVQFTPYNHIVFSDIIEYADIPKMTVWRATLDVWQKIRELDKDLVAYCTGEFLNSGPYLERLGFTRCNDIEEMEVYRWQTHLH